jgi:hypothetical protein
MPNRADGEAPDGVRRVHVLFQGLNRRISFNLPEKQQQGLQVLQKRDSRHVDSTFVVASALQHKRNAKSRHGHVKYIYLSVTQGKHVSIAQRLILNLRFLSQHYHYLLETSPRIDRSSHLVSEQSPCSTALMGPPRRCYVLSTRRIQS